jgi:hypothetical protein
MKESKTNYGGVEEDYSGKALFIFFLIGMIIISVATVVLFNL